MDAFDPCGIITLPTENYNVFRGIAFDGCFFYLTMPKKRCVYKLTEDFDPIRVYYVNKPYAQICYDHKSNCLWATEDRRKNLIYKLDLKMNEIDRIQIMGCPESCSNIMGLSYNCEKNVLIAAYMKCVLEISIESSRSKVLLKLCEGCCTGVLSIAPYNVVAVKEERKQEIRIFSEENCLIKSFYVPDLYGVKDLLFYPYSENKSFEIELMLLAAKHFCYPRILRCRIKGGFILSNCNYEICGACPEEGYESLYASDLIESITQVETSLSHILDAEVEKLQKAIQISESIGDLLEINKSVNKTILNAAYLENILFAKLAVVDDLFKNDNSCPDWPYDEK